MLHAPTTENKTRENAANSRDANGLPAYLPVRETSPRVAQRPAFGNRAGIQVRPLPLRPSQAPVLQRKCACGGTCSECRSRTNALQSVATKQAERNTHTLFETDQRTQTLDTATADGGTGSAGAAANGGAGNVKPAANGCGVTGSFSSIPNGMLEAHLSGNIIGAEFDMIGNFAPTAIPCKCACGEYRQYIRGSFNSNGLPVVQHLCGTDLHPVEFHEDCVRADGIDYKYGYRAHSFTSSNFTNPDQATGCRFVGGDHPRFPGKSGDEIEMDLDFKGSLIDTCNDNKILASAEWSVVGLEKVP